MVTFLIAQRSIYGVDRIVPNHYSLPTPTRTGPADMSVPVNHNRMTIRSYGNGFAVFKMKAAQSGGYATDMGARRFSWSVSAAASPRFVGSHCECLQFIADSGAEFMSEHGIPC